MAPGPHDADEPVEEPVPDGSTDDAAVPAEPDETGGTGTGDTDEPGEAPGPGAPEAAGELGEPDVQARWEQIVAQLGDVDLEATADVDAVPPPRAGSDQPEDAGRTPGTSDPQGRTIRPARRADDPRSWTPDPAAEEAEDHFQPPDPGPVLGGDPLLTMAWTAAIGVPVLLILAVVLWRDLPTIALAVAGALFLAGVGLLLWRMPHGDEDDEDRSGPGAVV